MIMKGLTKGKWLVLLFLAACVLAQDSQNDPTTSVEPSSTSSDKTLNDSTLPSTESEPSSTTSSDTEHSPFSDQPKPQKKLRKNASTIIPTTEALKEVTKATTLLSNSPTSTESSTTSTDSERPNPNNDLNDTLSEKRKEPNTRSNASSSESNGSNLNFSPSVKSSSLNSQSDETTLPSTTPTTTTTKPFFSSSPTSSSSSSSSSTSSTSSTSSSFTTVPQTETTESSLQTSTNEVLSDNSQSDNSLSSSISTKEPIVIESSSPSIKTSTTKGVEIEPLTLTTTVKATEPTFDKNSTEIDKFDSPSQTISSSLAATLPTESVTASSTTTDDFMPKSTENDKVNLNNKPVTELPSKTTFISTLSTTTLPTTSPSTQTITTDTTTAVSTSPSSPSSSTTNFTILPLSESVWKKDENNSKTFEDHTVYLVFKNITFNVNSWKIDFAKRKPDLVRNVRELLTENRLDLFFLEPLPNVYKEYVQLTLVASLDSENRSFVKASRLADALESNQTLVEQAVGLTLVLITTDQTQVDLYIKNVWSAIWQFAQSWPVLLGFVITICLLVLLIVIVIFRHCIKRSKTYFDTQTPLGQANPAYSEVGGCLNNGFVIDLSPSKFDRSDLQNVYLDEKHSNNALENWGFSQFIQDKDSGLDVNGNESKQHTNGTVKGKPLIDTRL